MDHGHGLHEGPWTLGLGREAAVVAVIQLRDVRLDLLLDVAQPEACVLVAVVHPVDVVVLSSG